jgi:PIN domain nuclease of toxin-antitoxin system
MILLDTPVVAWLAMEPDAISTAAREAISAARVEGGVAISDKTLWELAMMVSGKKIELDEPLRDFLLAVERYARVFPVDAAIADRSVRFGPNFPRDPADRIIAATAIVHGLELVTADKSVRESGEVRCIW